MNQSLQLSLRFGDLFREGGAIGYLLNLTPLPIPIKIKSVFPFSCPPDSMVTKRSFYQLLFFFWWLNDLVLGRYRVYMVVATITKSTKQQSHKNCPSKSLYQCLYVSVFKTDFIVPITTKTLSQQGTSKTLHKLTLQSLPSGLLTTSDW